MRLKPVLSLILFSVLSGTFALAQQPNGTSPAPPSSFHAPPGQLPGQFPRQMGRDEGGMREGMHSGFHIAPPGMWWKNPDLVQTLALTPDQQKRMDETFQQSRIQLVHMKASLEEQQILLEPMLNANPLDEAKTFAQISHIADTRADLEKANAKMLLSLRSVLTPDQWTKLQSQERENRRMMMQRFRRPDSRGEAPLPPPTP
jgi:Spy/CpxP family protein refolding chaperone